MKFYKNLFNTQIANMKYITLVFFVFYSLMTFAKDKKETKKDSTTTQLKVPKKKKSFDDSLKSNKRFDGIFKFYQDTSKGTVLMAIKKAQLGKEYVYFAYTENGQVSTGSFRGNFRDNKVFTIRKMYDKLEFVVLNTNFYFDTTHALSKAADANVSNAILFSKKIIDTDVENGEYLINMDDVFLSELLHRIKPSPPRGVPSDSYFSLGGLSKEKSKVIKIKTYPQNADVLVEYVFENTHPSVGGGAEMADDRNITIQIQHSFIEVPQNNYKPRKDDYRVGFFMTPTNDMTSPSSTNYRDFIHRWHLEKKDISASLSEPKKPIVWWIEKTTPKEWRQTIKEAALTWNVAFEKAGFKNAIEIYVQPDSASWDAGDIRYNVLRWSSSPNPIFGGYGPSFVNPRTGQILGSDIMLEYVFLTNRMKLEKFFDRSGLLFLDSHTDGSTCSLENNMQHNLQLGQLANYENDTIKNSELMKQAVYYLVLHELGHTLGLTHNMKASNMLKGDKLNDVKYTSENGLTASVMDYPTINIALEISKQGDYFTKTPGPYDKWVIEYGYKTFENDEKEKSGLETILARSTEPFLAYGNDADDMRSPGVHIDPRAMIHDLSGDAIGYMTDRLKLTTSLSGGLFQRYTKNGNSYHELRQAYLMLTGEQSNAATVLSRYVAGVYVDRNPVGSTKIPFVAVPLADQKRAFDAVSTYIFSPTAFLFGKELYPYLQIQRRGFGMIGQNEDPKIHDRILTIQKNVFDQWLHPNVLKRLTDSKMYGNKYQISDFLNDLTGAVFLADLNNNVNTFRQNLQTEYTQRISTILKIDNPNYDYISKANLLFQLKKIKTMLQSTLAQTTEIKIHRENIVRIIDKSLEIK